MQEVLGAYSTDLSRVAQLSSIDMATNQGPHSFLRKSFAPQIQTIVRQAEAPDGYSPVRGSREPSANGFSARAIQGQAGAALDRDLADMMIDCSCVCHLSFQNEVIGG